jgi:inosine-uridine nucleoside N-ribohydrolase
MKILHLCVLALGLAAAAGAAPVPLIFDTDMDTDCDDAGALAILHTLADRGEVEILATVVSSRHKWAAPCVAAINAWHGRPDIPIGVPKSKAKVWDRRGSKYAQKISEKHSPALKSGDAAPDAVAVYRKILAAQPSNNVGLCSVGDLTNMRDLLLSKPDAASPLGGRELVAQKIKVWVCMGGRYPKHLDPGVFGNFKPDPLSTVEAVRDWPGVIVFTGLGDDILTGGRLRETPVDNPVRQAYEIYLGKTPTRPSWDPIAVLYAVRPDAPLWTIHATGHNHIFENGCNEWREGPPTNQRLLELKPGAEKELRDTLDRLMIQPPKR